YPYVWQKRIVQCGTGGGNVALCTAILLAFIPKSDYTYARQANSSHTNMIRHRRRQKRHQRQYRSQRAQRSSFFIKRLKYLPAIIISLAASLLWSQPHLLFLRNDQDVLSYATNVSTSGLLSATNTQRTNNNVAALTT